MAQVTAPSSWPLARRINKAALSRLSRLRHRRVVTLPTDRAILALSFDDVPMSAAIEGARILDRFGVRATYYVCGGIDPAEPGAPFADAATLQSLSRDGFEIGCHSFRHIDFQDHDLRALTTDLDRNARWFAENGLPEPRSFAYPYGRTRPLAKALCAGRFALCRGVKPAWVRGAFDAALAPSLPLFADAGSVALLDQAMRRGRGGRVCLYPCRDRYARAL